MNPIAIRSALIYGVSRTGKTAFCGSFPAPAIISSKREDGLVTLDYMNEDLFYDPRVKPRQYPVSTIPEMRAKLNEIKPLVAMGRVRTIVLELSFYSDDVVLFFKASAKDPRQAYGSLEEHMMLLDDELKKIPNAIIVYNTLAAPNDDPKNPGGPIIAGRTLPKKIPALSALTGYLRTEELSGKIDRILHLEPYGAWQAGHRFGNRLPGFIRNPTYRKIEDLLAQRAYADSAGNVIAGAPPVVVQIPASLPVLSALPPLPASDLNTSVK